MAFEQRHRVARATKLSSVSDIQIPEDVGNLDQLIINVILLLLGTFMDMSPLIIIMTPILLPVAQAIGVDPVHFGIIMMLNLGIGLVTPPVGSVLFVAAAIGKTRMETALRTIWPFYGALILALILVTYFPQLSLALPQWMKGAG